MSKWKRVPVYGVGVLSVLLVTACGSGTASSKPDVATLRSEAPAPATAAANGSKRPFVRPDMTNAEFIALHNVWARCLGDHGVQLLKMGEQIKWVSDLEDPRYKPAVEACADKKPEDWREFEERTNPTEYADRMRAKQQCMKAKGVDPTKNLGPENSGEVGRMLEVAGECEDQAFADVIARHRKNNGK